MDHVIDLCFSTRESIVLVCIVVSNALLPSPLLLSPECLVPGQHLLYFGTPLFWARTDYFPDEQIYQFTFSFQE